MEGVKIRVKHGDAFTVDGDVLALKYAQEAYGLDKDIIRELKQIDESVVKSLPLENGYYYTGSKNVIASENIIFIGVPPLRQFGYKEIREFGAKVLRSLASSSPEIKKLIITIHGPGYGLDEIESFESELAGLVDSIGSEDYPEALEEIIFVERSKGRAARMHNFLAKFFPHGIIHDAESDRLKEMTEESNKILKSAGVEVKKKIFVAMPFAEEFDDIFHYGIKGAVNAAGFLAERADLEVFTGDVIDWVKKKIEDAEFVIADLTNANPNVYLEVGFAWGKNKQTILIIQDTNQLKFDVRGQRTIPYKRIKDLEEALTKEIIGLKEK